MPYQVGQAFFPIQGEPRNPAGDPVAVYSDKLPHDQVPFCTGFILRELADKSGVLICLFRPSKFVPHAATVLLTHCCFGLVFADEVSAGNLVLREKATSWLNKLASQGILDMDYVMGDPLNPRNRPST